VINRAYIFRAHEAIPGFFDTLFGGLFVTKGVPLAAQLGVLVFFTIAATAVALSYADEARRWDRVAAGATLVAFVLSALLCLQPWDETFVNLRHARHLAERGVYSFNALERIEGTVDFFPLVLLAGAARLGLGIPEGAFVLSLSGSLLALMACAGLFRAWGLGRHVPALVLALAMHGPLAFNASHGFFPGFVAAGALAAIRWLWFEPRPVLGLAVLAALPLFRIETALLVVVLGGAHAMASRNPRRAISLVGAALLPAAALSAWRWGYFGSSLPVPVRFKACGSLFFLLLGIRNLVADCLASHAAAAVAVLGFLAITAKRAARSNLVLILRPAVLLATFSAPYYFSGGDWFPSYWGRYLLPFSLYCLVAAGAALLTHWGRLSPGERSASLVLTTSVTVLALVWPISSTHKLWETLLLQRRTLARIHGKQVSRGHYRIQNLSQLGLHLGRTTQASDRIGSSEVATIMYHADRETIDMLGIANPELATAPLRQAPPMIRPFPAEAELPYLIFKRLDPGYLARKHPEVLYTFDFLLADQLPGVPFEEITDQSLFEALDRWERDLGGLNTALYGGMAAILRLGYTPFVVLYPNGFCALYFMAARTVPGHLELLARAGLTGGKRVSSSRRAWPGAGESAVPPTEHR